MSKALVTIGSVTNHGGIVSECDTTFIINGIAVHLNGMNHFCPKCKIIVSAIASDKTTIVNGRAVVLAGDKTTCGATFIGNQHLVVAQPKSSSSSSSAISKLNSAQSPIEKAASSLPNMTMGFTDQSNQPKGPFSGNGRGDSDTTRGVLNDLTFGISEKVLTVLGMEPADPKKLEEGEIVGAVIGPGKFKIAAKAAKETLSNGLKSAYEIAKNGGKHASTYKKYSQTPTKEIEKGIRSLEKQVKEHSDLIKNPSETMKRLGKGDWDSLDPRQQKALLEKKWPGDIQRQKETIEIFKGILKERGE